MKTKEEFVAAYQDELIGMLLVAFYEANAEGVTKFHSDKLGRMMIGQMRHAKQFLEKIYGNDVVQPIQKPVPANGPVPVPAKGPVR